MKKSFLALLVMVTGFIGTLQAQDTEITDQDLYQFALLSHVVDQMKAQVSATINDMIKQQDGIDGPRYAELSKAGDTEAAWKKAGAKDFEVQFMKLTVKEQNERLKSIKEAYKILATKMLAGNGKMFKAIKSGLSSDPDLKARYEKIEQATAMPSES